MQYMYVYVAEFYSAIKRNKALALYCGWIRKAECQVQGDWHKGRVIYGYV